MRTWDHTQTSTSEFWPTMIPPVYWTKAQSSRRLARAGFVTRDLDPIGGPDRIP
jgi:hypothetical protein